MGDATKLATYPPPGIDPPRETPEAGANSGIRTRPTSIPPESAGWASAGEHVPPSLLRAVNAREPLTWRLGFRDELEVAEIVDKCTIRSGCLDIVLPLTTSVCSSKSMNRIRAFIDANATLRSYPLLSRRRICERAVVVAAEMLGDDSHLTRGQLSQKAAHHLLMSVEMVIEWLLDDTLDLNSSVEPSFRSAVAHLYAGMIQEEAVDIEDHAALIREGSARNNVPETFLDAMLSLLEWRRSLSFTTGVPHDMSSLSLDLLTRFLGSYLRTGNVFESWNAYEIHRADNGALPLEILFGTYWNCYRWKIDPALLEQDQGRFVSLLSRYGVVGALSNDLFGYEKDLEEGVATSVEVAKRSLVAGTGDNDSRTHEAFARVIEIHNARLDELAERARTREDPLEAAMLFSCLRSVWSIRVLHQEYGAIYHPGWLKRALLAGAAGGPSARKSRAR